MQGLSKPAILAAILAAAAPSTAGASVASADTYLKWCQNNIRDGLTARADKHCGWYARDAAAAGLAVFGRAEIEAAVAAGERLDAAAAGPATSTPQSGPGPQDPVSEPEPTPKPPVTDWDFAYRDKWDRDGKPENGEATPETKALAQSMARDLVGDGYKELQQGYMSRTYRGYDEPVQSGGQNVYLRHLGFDVSKQIGATVRAVTNGKVVSLLGQESDPNDIAVIVKETDADRWWVYGHVTHGVQLGQNVAKGTPLGTMVDPQGMWPPHVHVTVFTTPWPLASDVRPYFGWGLARAGSQQETVSRALEHTMQPLEGYFLSGG